VLPLADQRTDETFRHAGAGKIFNNDAIVPPECYNCPLLRGVVLVPMKQSPGLAFAQNALQTLKIASGNAILSGLATGEYVVGSSVISTMRQMGIHQIWLSIVSW